MKRALKELAVEVAIALVMDPLACAISIFALLASMIFIMERLF